MPTEVTSWSLALPGLVAGALSMAAGEYVSVSSQADAERADLTRERTELATDPVGEEDELAGIYSSAVSNLRWPESSPSS